MNLAHITTKDLEKMKSVTSKFAQLFSTIDVNLEYEKKYNYQEDPMWQIRVYLYKRWEELQNELETRIASLENGLPF